MRYRRGDWWSCHGWDGEGVLRLPGREPHYGHDVVEPDLTAPPSRHGFRRAVPAASKARA